MCYLAWVVLTEHFRSFLTRFVADASGLCDAKNNLSERP